MRKAIGSVALCLALICLAFTFMAAHDFVFGDEQNTLRGVLGGLFILFGCGALALGWAAFQRLRPYRPGVPRGRFEQEQAVLQQAARMNGRISVAGAATYGQLPVNVAHDILSALHRRGVCDIELDSDGVLYYTFPTGDGRRLIS